MPVSESSIEVAGSPERAGAVVERAAELWGAESERRGAGRFGLRLNVAAGLRRGSMTGEVRVEPAGPDGARVTFHPESSEYRLQTAQVGMLVLGALGTIVLLLCPFLPALVPLAPIGIVLGLAAWFLVLSRLHSSGPAEFLGTVAERIAAGEGDGEAEAAGEG